MVVAVMGTTEESSIDPLTEILKQREQFSKKVSPQPEFLELQNISQ